MLYDLCFAWNWEYDADFAALLAGACRDSGLTLLEVTPETIEPVIFKLDAQEDSFRALFDRASDSDERFYPLAHLAERCAAWSLNQRWLAQRLWNKADCHFTLIRAGLQTPHTIVLPSFIEQPDLSPVELALLGENFNIKPAHGGGGEGVVTGATHWQQILEVRGQYPHDQYLLQSHITPARLGGREAWFRILFACGRVYPCWWDTGTHVYTPVSAVDEAEYALQPLREMAHTIASVCPLDIFSTEVARTEEGSFVVVDYVNDPIDLRLRSNAEDGVPDVVVQNIAATVVEQVGRRIAR